MPITTSMPTSFKSELFSRAHCFGATLTLTGNTHTSNIIDVITPNLNGVAVGMTITDSNSDLPASTVISKILSATSVQTSQAATGTHTGATLTLFGDIFKIALIKHLPTSSPGAGTVNYADLGADEATGTGYTAGGLNLANVSPSISGTTAMTSWSGSTSWTSATLDVDGCLIYNSTPAPRLGGSSGSNTLGAGRAVYVGDFGGRQQVTAGTLTILMPTVGPTTAILRLQ